MLEIREAAASAGRGIVAGMQRGDAIDDLSAKVIRLGQRLNQVAGSLLSLLGKRQCQNANADCNSARTILDKIKGQVSAVSAPAATRTVNVNISLDGRGTRQVQDTSERGANNLQAFLRELGAAKGLRL